MSDDRKLSVWVEYNNDMLFGDGDEYAVVAGGSVYSPVIFSADGEGGGYFYIPDDVFEEQRPLDHTFEYLAKIDDLIKELEKL